ncbi:MAG: cbb3-type cytochrome c oxidase subunit I [Ignavibacteriales bacterium]|nr:cbb3-type cytochrome c oxidase subunit I [Ignavibacteriales bacterium]
MPRRKSDVAGSHAEFKSRDAHADEHLRISIDDSARTPTVFYFATAVGWLVVGTIAGVITSLKFNLPDFLGDIPALTFGRIRPVHLNTVMYGWASLAGAGMIVWLTARLCRVPLQWGWLQYLAAIFWNLGVLAGTVAILTGYSQGLEWLEFPTFAGALIAGGFLLFAASIVQTFRKRNVEHLYVSLWYIMASLLWFPVLYVVANLGIYQGVVEAAMNWWYGHNALATWFTPIGLAGAYYFIPKVIGRPIYSYYLGLLGFWAFALFYNWNGIHHLVGGPLPTWLVTVSIVASVMMVVPVMAVAVNHHMTTVNHFRMLRFSPTLRFVVFGSMCYTAVSFQGSLESIRSIQEVAHFTHYTIGHAHLGVYGFLTMILFGAMYYIIPRLAKWEWPYPGLIKVHFWSTAIGIAVYVTALSIGGWFQGIEMNDPSIPFLDVVRNTQPYLWARSASGVLILVGHLIFAYQFFVVIKRAGPRRFAPALFREPAPLEPATTEEQRP